MKSVVIQQPNALEIEERPLPLPGQATSASKLSSPVSAVQTAISIAGITRLQNIRG